MSYSRKCIYCEKEFEALRPHGASCSNACRQAYHRLPEKMSSLFAKLKKKQREIRKSSQQINLQKKQLAEHQIEVEKIKHSHSQHYRLLTENYQSFYFRLKGSTDTFSKKHVFVASDFSDYYHKGNVKVFEESKQQVQIVFDKLEEELDEATCQKDKQEVNLFRLRRDYHKLSQSARLLGEQIDELKKKFEPEVNAGKATPKKLPGKPK